MSLIIFYLLLLILSRNGIKKSRRTNQGQLESDEESEQLLLEKELEYVELARQQNLQFQLQKQTILSRLVKDVKKSSRKIKRQKSSFQIL